MNDSQMQRKAKIHLYRTKDQKTTRTKIKRGIVAGSDAALGLIKITIHRNSYHSQTYHESQECVLLSY